MQQTPNCSNFIPLPVVNAKVKRASGTNVSNSPNLYLEIKNPEFAKKNGANVVTTRYTALERARPGGYLPGNHFPALEHDAARDAGLTQTTRQTRA